ncbi:hypothetical protein GCM10023149_23360 [Mucilaginibacter gynuensis]|uniref:Uncharacterized protein n=2 Tax=Mucilaginibacter gynuensis TaxID=1302236 RepID=A0ABP8GED7_9SPHI
MAQSEVVAQIDSVKKPAQRAIKPKNRSKLDSIAGAYNTKQGQNQASSPQQSSTGAKASAAASALGKLSDLFPGRKRNNTGTGNSSSAGSSAPTNNGSAPSTTELNVNSGKMSIKNIDNGIDFTVTGCIGNSHNQTVTLYFSFSNPNKVHQLIKMGFHSYSLKTNALDNESNTFDASLITLAGENNTNNYRTLSKQLPTGNSMKGSVTFSNILSSVQQFTLVNLLTETSNWSGGGDKKGGLIEVRNVPITWSN